MPHTNPSPGAGMSTAEGRHRRIVVSLFLLGWLTFLALPPIVLTRYRGAWLASLESAEVQENWDDFRRDMRAHSGREGPVQRKVPKSAEPPLRVWLRDYFGLAITAWVILGGTLGAFLGMMVVGALGHAPHSRLRAGERSLAEHDSGRRHDRDEQDQRDPENTQQ